MHIIQIKAVDEEQGAYNDHKSDNITAPPDGWAMIPEDMVLPSTFPRLGSQPEVKEIAYPYTVMVEKDVVKTRDVEVIGEDGEVTVVQEEYTEKEMVAEQRERIILTVTKMTEGTLPEPEPEPEPVEDVSWEDMAAAITEGVNEV